MGTKQRRRVGLAFGGGAVRGMAHVGVVAVLERAGIPVDFVAGTSAGSLIGACVAAGLSAEQIMALARRMNWRTAARPTWPRDGFLSFAALERWIIEELGDLHFTDLQRPFAAVTTDIRTGQRVVVRQGRLAPAVCASSAVPGFVAPVEIEGRLLADGGVVDNLPAAVVRDMGADYVIAVNVMGNRPSWTRGPFGLGLSAIETLIRNTAGGQCEANCLISPPTEDCSLVRFSHRERLIALGQQAAEEKLPEIRRALDL